MANLIECAKCQIDELIQSALKKAIANEKLPEGTLSGSVDIPKDTKNGDYAANHAMTGAKAFKLAPRKIAETICEEMALEGSYFESVEIAGPGFLNFRLGQKWFSDVLFAIDAEGENYGKSDVGKNEKVMIEFVSANPTGPMTIGNARGGVLGDALASVMNMAGYNVEREFYVNDAGNQVDLFGKSIEARYLQICLGEDAVAFPEDGYHGDDIKALAKMIFDQDGDKYVNISEIDRRKAFVEFGLPHNIALMKKHLERYRINFNTWFLESSIHASGYVEDTVNELTKGGLTYEKDGALWLKNTELGADKDEVLKRANGFYTYYAVDIAYHRNKFVVRNFERVIDVMGADHHGHAIRFGNSMKAECLGLADKKLDFLIMQMVRLVRGDEVVKVSKRTGKALTLNDLLDEIGVDACRFFFNAKPDTHLEFDLDLAVRQDSENPVYYVQYAHARICTMIANLVAEGMKMPKASETDFAKLSEEQELDLIKQLSAFPEEIALAAKNYDPSRINRYVTELAAKFHRFYNACRIKDAEADIAEARLKLCDSVRVVIATALKLVGVSAPEKM